MNPRQSCSILSRLNWIAVSMSQAEYMTVKCEVKCVVKCEVKCDSKVCSYCCIVSSTVTKILG